MKTRSKALLLALCAVLLVVVTAFGTLAYLTDTDNETNTFTIGEVDITLDEAKVTEDGKPVEGADRVQANTYHLVPGYTYTKDPQVHVTAGSSKSYVRMKVTVSNIAELKEAFPKTKYPDYYAGETFLLQMLVDWNEMEWPCAGISDDGDTYEFRYYQTVDASKATEDLDLEPLFTAIKVPGEMTVDEVGHLNNMQINVVAHAMQADGFDSAEEAWENFTTN